jgi:hypothetical protein
MAMAVEYFHLGSYNNDVLNGQDFALISTLVSDNISFFGLT